MTTQHAYASLPHVSTFVTWLAAELDSQTLFKHAYVDRRSGVEWSCDGLFDAYQSYHWNFPGNPRLGYNPGACAAANATALGALRQDLIAAGSDDRLLLRACIDVMAWGGVTAHNVDWLKANQRGLGGTLHAVKSALLAGDENAPVLRSKNLRFNSGMTKVYALLCPGICIYDSRVAAGLGALVVEYCKAHRLTAVPAGLCFPWAAAKEGQGAVAPKRRNPSTGSLHFKRLRAGTHHARWNLRASWVLNQVAELARSTDSPLRLVEPPMDIRLALENSLFMRGYDLGA
ncbi:hypothetical protein CCOS865_01238 [Pseudomonas reidholzensis]|uniref:Uncharacterized protein n=1 Tax=Pseudomonas reidholzensis TaxID=1785162 RepID=A0A383RRL5_9PSED|nr:hypothetical protein [Pseudomonas reidholzensis]SYX88998.1 hypothetical protein CCOS865_01238 [Pseudomonas reidholzensis]